MLQNSPYFRIIKPDLQCGCRYNNISFYFNTWITDQGPGQGVSILSFEGTTDDAIGGALLAGGEIWQLSEAGISQSATLDISGRITGDDSSGSFTFGVANYPEGGHTCIAGQVGD